MIWMSRLWSGTLHLTSLHWLLTKCSNSCSTQQKQQEVNKSTSAAMHICWNYWGKEHQQLTILCWIKLGNTYSMGSCHGPKAISSIWSIRTTATCGLSTAFCLKDVTIHTLTNFYRIKGLGRLVSNMNGIFSLGTSPVMQLRISALV